MPGVDIQQQQQQQYREKKEVENVLPVLSSELDFLANRRGSQSVSVQFIMPAKVVDQTMTTISLSMEDFDDEKDDYEEEDEERMVLAAMPTMIPSRLVWKDDCEPPSPIRKLVTTQQAPDRVVVLNTRHSLLGEETDTDGEEEDDDYNYNKIVAEADTTTDQDDDFDEQEYNDQLTKLNFRLEMEEHAREGMDHLLLPEIPETRDKPDPISPRRVTPTKAEKSSPEPVTTVSTQKVSMLESMTVGFVDTLCMPPRYCGTRNPTLPTTTSSPVEYENSLHQGFLQVLGCSSPPDDDEIAQLWDMDTALQMSCTLPADSPRRLTYPPVPEPPTGPHRPGPRERISRLRRWRRERSLVAHDFPDRTNSMDIGAMEESQFHQDDQEDSLTYDSDPEMSVSMRGKKKSAQNSKTTPSPSTPKRRSCTYRWMVRESMNQNWELKWHTEKKGSKQVRAWMERGTIVGGQMLEPALVLRHGNDCTQLRFLNICRILPATPDEQIRASILSRPSCTLRIMTSLGEEFFLEAASKAQRNEIVDTWKLCIARFATLAVLEDVDSIQREFFHAGCHSYVPDVEDVMDDMERDAKLDD